MLKWISGCDQLVDRLTKPLPKIAFDIFIRRIGFINGFLSESD
jgi:hypothetical protein